jgi:hypothetical protein
MARRGFMYYKNPEPRGSGTFLSFAAIFWPKQKIPEVDFSWVEPLRRGGPNLFNIGCQAREKTARFLGLRSLV